MPKHNNSIDVASSVLTQEIAGLSALVAWLGQPFTEAIECIQKIDGRVIVTGMGKSGHIARKIAATMASTGTPAYFVHPGEASHGDLGMITRHDAVLALSNSGETSELADIITYCKRFNIPLIAMVRRKQSMLVKAANVALVLPDVPEASPINAPTTSTTMMLALGDALSVVLLEAKGFTKELFSHYHPGGKLGKVFVKVKDLMHGKDELPLVSEKDLMPEILLAMTARRFGCAGVCNAQGKLVGIITDGDLRRHMEKALLEKTALEVMTGKPVTIQPDMLAAEALSMMNDRSITSLFVLENTIPVGILHIHDCLRAGII